MMVGARSGGAFDHKTRAWAVESPVSRILGLEGTGEAGEHRGVW